MRKPTKKHSREFSRYRINGQSFEIVEKFCYLGDTIGATGCAADSVVMRIRGNTFVNQ